MGGNMRIKRIISLILIVLIMCFALTINAEAASVSISANSTSVTVGTKVTITVSGTAAAWDLSVSGSGVSTTPIVGYTSDAENGSFSKSVSFTPSSAGTYTVNLTGNITDAANTESTKINKSVTIKVNSKSSSSSSGGSSSTGSGNGTSGSNSSSGSNSKPSGSSQNKPSTTNTAPSFTSVNETVYATDSVNVRSSYSTSSSAIGSLKKGDSVTRTGKATKAVNGITWSRVTYNGKTAYVSSSYLTTEKPEDEKEDEKEDKKSNNKDLKELTIEGDYTLTPEFSADVTEYDLNVDEDVDSIEIKGVADDENAKVEISGNDNLLMGINTVTIKVTSTDGTTKTYKINVIKGNVSEFGLAELSVDGYTLSPEFNSNEYSYIVDVPDLSVTSLKINALTNDENAEVEIIGADNLVQGENIITILVKNADGENTVTYQITANIHEPEKTQLIAGIDDEDLFLYGGIAIGVIVVIIIIVVIVIHNRKRDEEFGTYYGGFDSFNKDANEQENYDDLYGQKNSVKKENDEANVADEKKTVNNNDDINTKLGSAFDSKKSVIEENFGENNNGLDDEQPKRKKGKHF